MPRHDVTDRRTERGADTLQRRYRAETGIDVTGTGDNACDKSRHRDAKDAGANAVQNLDRHKPSRSGDRRRQCSAQRQREQRRHDENGAETVQIVGKARQCRSANVAKMIAGLAASQLAGKAGLMDQTQSNRRDGRCDRRAGEADCRLCYGDDGKHGREVDRTGTKRNSSRTCHRFCALESRVIDRRTEWCRHRQSTDAGKGRDRADRRRRPRVRLKEYTKERTEARLYIGHEEIQRAECEQRILHTAPACDEVFTTVNNPATVLFRVIELCRTAVAIRRY